ncbi:hypothetical protein HMPREF9629_00903, partial [Peptoanaerobacter stomatis]
MKLRSRMLASIGVPVLLVLLILSVVSYKYSDSLLTNESEQLMSMTAQKYGSDIETLIQRKISYLDMIALEFVKRAPGEKELIDDLKYYTQKVPGTSGFFVGLDSGKYYDGTGWVPDTSFDHTTREWYKGAIGKTTPFISKPYNNSSDGLMVVTISEGVNPIDTSRPKGVVGTDISTKEIIEEVSSIKVGKTGAAFLIDGDGNFISHQKYTFNDNLSTVENGALQPFMDKFLDTESDFFRAKVGGVQRFYFTYPIKNTNWVLALSVPKAEVLEGSSTLGKFMIILSIISLIIVIAVIYLVANSITIPIIKLSQCVQGMAQYDLTLTDKSP